MSAIIDFYQDKPIEISHGLVKWSEIIYDWTDDEWEGVHDFIQWVFPTNEPSKFNKQASLLTEDDINYFKNDNSISLRLMLSFFRFQRFLGLDLSRKNPMISDKLHDNLLIPNHNWMRITRCLKSLTLLGFENTALRFYGFLEGYNRKMLDYKNETLEYWRKSVCQ